MESSGTFYLAKDEPPPEPVCKSKRFIPKVMFLAAVARPRYGNDGKLLWDGKLGMWPFTEMVAAKRASRNRPAGTMELRNLTVTKKVYVDFIMQKVFPSIRKNWPERKPPVINVVQDNAPVHMKADDTKIVEAGQFMDGTSG